MSKEVLGKAHEKDSCRLRCRRKVQKFNLYIFKEEGRAESRYDVKHDDKRNNSEYINEKNI